MNEIPSSLYHLYLSFIPSTYQSLFIIYTFILRLYIIILIIILIYLSDTIYSLLLTIVTPHYYHIHICTYQHTITSISDNINISYLQPHTLCIHIHVYILYHSLEFILLTYPYLLTHYYINTLFIV